MGCSSARIEKLGFLLVELLQVPPEEIGDLARRDLDPRAFKERLEFWLRHPARMVKNEHHTADPRPNL